MVFQIARKCIWVLIVAVPIQFWHCQKNRFDNSEARIFVQAFLTFMSAEEFAAGYLMLATDYQEAASYSVFVEKVTPVYSRRCSRTGPETKHIPFAPSGRNVPFVAFTYILACPNSLTFSETVEVSIDTRSQEYAITKFDLRKVNRGHPGEAFPDPALKGKVQPILAGYRDLLTRAASGGPYRDLLVRRIVKPADPESSLGARRAIPGLLPLELLGGVSLSELQEGSQICYFSNARLNRTTFVVLGGKRVLASQTQVLVYLPQNQYYMVLVKVQESRP